MGTQDVKFWVVEGDAMMIEADVLMLKYAQRAYGLDKIVIGCIEKFVKDIYDMLPAPGKCRLVESFGVTRTNKILFVGVKQLQQVQYQGIREFAHVGLQELLWLMPNVKHVSVTVHGVNYGLDESEALRAQMAGFLDAIETGNAPPALEKVSIVERAASRAERLTAVLKEIFPRSFDHQTQSSAKYSSNLKTDWSTARH